MLTFRCRQCYLLVESAIPVHRCPSCGRLALRQMKTKEYRQMAKAPSHKPYSNYKRYEKGDF